MVFKKYKLKDLGEIVTGKTPKKSNKEYYNSNDIMFIKPDDLFQDNILLLDKSKEYISKKGAETVRVLPKNSVLVTCIGTIGKVAILYSDKAAFNQQINAIIPNEKIIISKFLAYSIWFNRLKLQAIANAPIVPIINKTQFSEFEIQVPNIDYQKKVVNILDKASDLINKRKSQIEALDQLTQSVFLEMFGDPVQNPKEWPKLTMPSFVSKEKYSIKRGPFGGALKKEIFVNQGYLVYEQHHAINNDFSMARYFISEEKFDELKAFEVKPNDLIISCSGTLGKIAEVPENAPKGIINQALLKLTLDKNKMNNTFFIHLFRNQGIQNILFGTSHGSGIKNFPPMSVVKSIEFICPPIDEQKKFETKFKQITKKRERFELSLKEIENLYNALMQRAFKGELFIEEKVSNL